MHDSTLVFLSKICQELKNALLSQIIKLLFAGLCLSFSLIISIALSSIFTF